MDRLPDLLESSRHCVVLTGAGISTLPGIPDFRGETGIFNKFDGTRLFSMEHFRKDPTYFYENSRDFIYNVGEKRPNIIHKVLAGLEVNGLVNTVITQNIDLLHKRAGSRNVIELHGSPERHRCLECGRDYPFIEISARVRAGTVPRCDCGGTIKPGIIFYGEMLDSHVLNLAVTESARADFMLVLGSSLTVNPAASLPLYTVASKGSIVLVNNQPTPLDDIAVIKYDDLEEVFEFLAGLYGIETKK